MRKNLLFIFIIGFCTLSYASQDTLLVVKSVNLVGNKVTKDKILLREITFKRGDTIGQEMFQQKLIHSRQNLMNISLFNFVDVKDSVVNNEAVKEVDVEFKVLERWYVWPLPIFELAERNLSVWLKDMDFSRVNYGFFLDWENFRGRRERLKILLQFGYDEKLGFSYSIPYIDKKQTIGLDFGFAQTKNHEVTYATEDNEVQRVKLVDEYGHRAYDAFVAVSHRPNIYQSHYFETSYNDHIYHDTVFDLNPEFFAANENRAQYVKLSYKYKNDHRDFKTFPLKGYYFDILLEKLGLGFFHGSDINVLNAKVNARKYWAFSDRFFLGTGATARIGNSAAHPYFLDYGMGYGRDFVRGYEYYVVDGQNYGLLKTDFKFALIPQKVSILKFIPTEKFNKIPWAIYLSLFSDFGYVPGHIEKGNDLHNTLLWGYGAGLNVVTYYDIVMRFEYSFNLKGEAGFFIHFMASI